MITRVVQENMDERQHRIERLDRLQQPDRRGGVDGQGLDHPGLPSLQVDRAVSLRRSSYLSDIIYVFAFFMENTQETIHKNRIIIRNYLEANGTKQNRRG